MKVLSLYLSTQSTGTKYTPYDKSNLANVKWNINWRDIFNEYIDRNVDCRVKCSLISSSSSTLTTSNNFGTVRANFSSVYGNVTNGFVLGMPILRTSVDGAGYYYVELDTIQTSGKSIIIPSSNFFNIQFLRPDENTLMSNIPEYQIILDFEIDVDDD